MFKRRMAGQFALLMALMVTFALGMTGRVDAQDKLKPGDTFRDCEGCPEMVVVPAGSFMMGSPESEKDRENDEGPQHEVTVAKPFAVGRFEITRGQFEEFAKATDFKVDASCSFRDPGVKQTDEHPVVCVSWDDTLTYARWLSTKTGHNYRQLTEAEWEYSARAGTTTAYATGKTITKKQANFDSSGTVKVGQFAANRFGLYDMHGNVWEWIRDCYVNSYKDAPLDGSSIKDSNGCWRIARDGAWYGFPDWLRSANRYRYRPELRVNYLGFRLARTL
jgi:formylglycine-generating enzyme required for sulfatase activity